MINIYVFSGQWNMYKFLFKLVPDVEKYPVKNVEGRPTLYSAFFELYGVRGTFLDKLERGKVLPLSMVIIGSIMESGASVDFVSSRSLVIGR